MAISMGKVYINGLINLNIQENGLMAKFKVLEYISTAMEGFIRVSGKII